MTDEQLRDYLQENGYPEHVWRAGRHGLLERWRKFVNEVERGYKFGLEDYRNDLDLRGVISLVGLDADARESDERLTKLLTAKDKRVWESAGTNPFWDFGYPANAAGELLEDLKAEGLYESAPNQRLNLVGQLLRSDRMRPVLLLLLSSVAALAADENLLALAIRAQTDFDRVDISAVSRIAGDDGLRAVASHGFARDHVRRICR